MAGQLDSVFAKAAKQVLKDIGTLWKQILFKLEKQAQLTIHQQER